jgi:hypothetical protein
MHPLGFGTSIRNVVVNLAANVGINTHLRNAVANGRKKLPTVESLLLMAGHFGSTRKPCRTPQQGFEERGKLVAKGSTLFYNQLLVLGFFGLLFFTLYVQPNFTLHCLSHYAFYLQCIYTSH